MGQKIIPVETVGCYIPGGKYPLISAAIMSVATAKVAGVPHVIGAAPPRDGEAMYAPTLYALSESGADEIYTIGGVQAFASMAYGCVGMKAVDMITGPGNAYVAEAKRQLFGLVVSTCPLDRQRSSSLRTRVPILHSSRLTCSGRRSTGRTVRLG